ncbi:hypothetical protein [Gluconobacter oxydans]|uniref:hypothetical protein n=1 Tax=Gluconobacter oxydans TaxID=442 RepID=UPI0039EA1DA2
MALYLYNARVAKAFLFPLGIVEVTLRNAIDVQLVTLYGSDWHSNTHFCTSVLTPESHAALQKAISRAGPNASHGQVIAELTFDFWSNLLRPDYGNFWRTNLNIVFPNIPRELSRHDVQTMVRNINIFRNRVAHHEPILDLNITDIHAKIVHLVSLRCTETAAWLRHHSTLSAVIRTRPRGPTAGFQTLGDRMARDFTTVTGTTSLDSIAQSFNRRCQVAVKVDEAFIPTAAFGPLDLIRFISVDMSRNDGFTILAERTVDELLTEINVMPHWTSIRECEPIAVAIDRLKQQETNIVVAVNASGKTVGVMTRALRRY